MKVVVIGNDIESLLALRAQLARDGFDVTSFATPHQFFRDLHSFFSRTVVVVACRPCGEVSSEAVVRRIRDLFRESVPIVVLGNRDVSGETVSALDAGADDFIAVNAPPDVLMARIRAVLRRYSTASARPRRVLLGDYEIDYGSQSVTLQGARIPLTPKEFDLFWLFASKSGRLISKTELMACVWGRHVALDTHTVSQHVYALRRKLRLDGHGLQLVAVYGAGYRLESSPCARVTEDCANLDHAETSTAFSAAGDSGALRNDWLDNSVSTHDTCGESAHSRCA